MQRKVVVGLGGAIWSIVQCCLAETSGAQMLRDRPLKRNASPAPTVLAQIIPDSTLPDNSTVRTERQRATIEGGSTRGTNLFHSFREFSVPAGTEAFFENGSGIENIFTRVTGSNLSEIDGRLGANGTANLFLLNPNGIIFGENASLAIGGSFFATTADRWVFADGAEFGAIASETPPLLTISAPIGLQMGSIPGAIVNRSRVTSVNPLFGSLGLPDTSGLEVAPGRTLALIGGEIALENGSLTALQGEIQLLSLGGGEQVFLTPTATGINFNNENVQTRQNIEIAGSATLNVSGAGGGAIALRGGEIDIRDDASLLAITLGDLDGRGIVIEGDRLRVADSARIVTVTISDGNAGDLSLRAAESIELSGLGTSVLQEFLLLATGLGGETVELGLDIANFGLLTSTLAEGNAGNIAIATRNLTMNAGALATTLTDSSGMGGNVFLSADTVELDGSSVATSGGPSSSGNAGDIEIEANALTLVDGGLISAGTVGSGNGGDVVVRADTITASRLPTGVFPLTGFSANSLTSGAASGNSRAGDIDIDVRRLLLTEGAFVASRGGSLIPVLSEGGAGGNVTIRASESIEVRGVSAEGQIPASIGTSSVGNSSAGSTIVQTEQLIVTEGGTIDVAGGLVLTGTGDAGTLEIVADSILLAEGGALSASTVSGQEGNIEIDTRSLRLSGESAIATNTESSTGGNIAIDAETIAAFDNSDITANAVAGDGGNIEITARGLFGIEFRSELTPQSDITASSEFGLQGTVTFNTPDVDPTASVAALPSQIGNAAPLLGDRCSAAVRDGSSRFSLAGRGGLPPSPYGLLDETDDRRERDRLADALKLRSDGLYRRSLSLLAILLEELENEPDSPFKAQVERHYAIALRLTGEFEASLEAFARARTMAATLSSRSDFAAVALGLGNTFKAQGNLEQARANYRLASTLAIAPSLKAPALLNEFALSVEAGDVAGAIARRAEIEAAIAELPQTRAAIYARLSYANNWSKLPGAEQDPALLSLLEMAAKSAADQQDARAQSYVLGTLGRIYERKQQWKSAQQATQTALVLAENLNASDLVYQWQWQLGRISDILGETENAIAAYGIAVASLQSLRKDLLGVSTDVQFSFRESVEPVYRQYIKLLLSDSEPLPASERQQRLRTSLQTLENLQLVELENFFQSACIPGEIAAIDELDRSAAAIHAIVLDESIEVIASLPGQPLQHARVWVTRAEGEQVKRELQQGLTLVPPQKAAWQPASKLYNWLVRPFAEQLQNQDIETLVFVLDDFLRNVPPAILYDGEQYLIEQYNVALTPGLQLLPSRQLPPGQIQGLLAGLAENRQGFQSLPGVVDEIDRISEIVPHEILFNETFTEPRFEQKIEQLPFNVVHLATHGQFSSRSEDTFIVTWDGKISVNELDGILRQRAISESEAIELLVLSACQTAAGDDRAVLGLAGVAVRSGARSTLATLWAVDDISTSLAMSEFYRHLSQPGATKAEALRRAQLELLNSQDYRHPFFWAPFVLVGNWQ